MQANIILFAQQKGGPEAALVLVPMLCIIVLEIILIVAVSAFQIYYLLVQYKALNAVSKHNRDMEPAMIFLVFIPLFGIVWNFFVVLRIASSLEKEFEERGLPPQTDFGKQLGITALILDLTCCLALGGLVCHVIHLRRLLAYTKMLESGEGRRRRKWDEREKYDDEGDDDVPPHDRGDDRIKV